MPPKKYHATIEQGGAGEVLCLLGFDLPSRATSKVAPASCASSIKRDQGSRGSLVEPAGSRRTAGFTTGISVGTPPGLKR